MKRKLIISIVIVSLFIVGYLSYRIFNNIQKLRIAQINTKTLPNFSFISTDGTKFTCSDISNINSKIVFNYFSPTCEHCQYMATQYLINIDKLKDITILMITIADSNSVAVFSNNYQLCSMPNIILLRDDKYDFYKIFGTMNVPSFFIYRNKKLVKKIIGETKIENILAPI